MRHYPQHENKKKNDHIAYISYEKFIETIQTTNIPQDTEHNNFRNDIKSKNLHKQEQPPDGTKELPYTSQDN